MTDPDAHAAQSAAQNAAQNAAQGPSTSDGATGSRPEVGYVARFVPGYRMAVMKAFSDRLANGLVVASGRAPGHSGMNSLMSETEMPSEGLRGLPLKNRWVLGERMHWQESAPLFGQDGPSRVLLIEESPRTMSLRPLLHRARRAGLKTILWGHFSSIHRPLDGSNWKDRQRLKTASMADALLTYTDELRDRVAELVPSMPVFAARNTLDTDKLFPLGDALLNEERSAIRSRLGLIEAPTLLFLGRLIPEKGPVRVVDTAAALACRLNMPVSVVMIGDGPERTAIEARAVEKNVPLTLKGAIADLGASAPWIAASDLLLNPGYLGLSVNHALALGVPVIAPGPDADGSGHSPEWVYVKDGLNGRLAASDSAEDLLTAVVDVLDDTDGFRERSARFAREELSLEQMMAGMLEAVRHVAPEVGLASGS